MDQQEETAQIPKKPDRLPKPPATSLKVTDHLANERTFLAWIRTGLATITFGFVVERFGLIVHELDSRAQSLFIFSLHASTLVGVALTLLGVAILVFAIISFLRNRRSIDAEQYHASATFAIVLTILASSIGVLLAIYLLFSL